MGEQFARNRKANHDYEFEEYYEAGIALKGTEVKALREGRGNLQDAYAIIRKEEVYVIGMYIGPYKHAPDNQQHDYERPRKLLLKKAQIKSLTGKISRKGYSLIPLQAYANKRGWVKIQLGLGKGLTKPDKRRKEKEKDVKRRLRKKYSAQIR